MARQRTTKHIGVKYHLTYYKMYDTFYVRTKSRGGKQTQATMLRQKDFAIAASLSATIRKALHVAIPNPKQRTMQNRLTKAVMQWVLSNPFNQTRTTQEITQLKDFSFTEDALLPQPFNTVMIQTNPSKNVLTITIPSFIPKQTVEAPAGTKQLQLTIAAASCAVTKKFKTTASQHQLMVPFTNTSQQEQTINFNLELSSSCITFVAFAINYLVKQSASGELQTIKQHKWQPSAIVFAQLQ